MNQSTAKYSADKAAHRPPAAARTVLQLLQKIRHGSLTLHLPDGSVQRFGDSANPHATLHLKNWNAFTGALKSGDIGFAESFIDGDWTTPDLTALLRVLVQNRAEVDRVIFGSWVGRLAYRIKHLLQRNTRSNSKKNIHAHYDLGNAFYSLWLDPTMNYSSALFGGDLTQSLSQAQSAKVRRALQQVDLAPGSRVLEIGCGWGALAEMATVEHSAHVTGVTLSTEQLDFARARMQRQGLAERTDLRLQDYRDIQDGPYDAVCSIEMIEAVGQGFWPTYFSTVARMLKPGGKACIQSIVIADTLFERYLASTDFIQQYIFPGGCLPSPSEFKAQARAAGLVVVQEHAFGHDYAHTLKRWREAFLAQREKVLSLGFDQRFMHIWEFYLCYCEAAFMEDNIDVLQYTLQKPHVAA
jgi:cyclopropane-fatty-acyl-phospholipid synthase